MGKDELDNRRIGKVFQKNIYLFKNLYNLPFFTSYSEVTYEAGYPKHSVYSCHYTIAYLPCSTMAHVGDDPVDKVLTAMIVIIAIVVIISLILKITGHSPENIQILYSLVIMIIISSFKLHYDTGGFKEFSRHARASFRNIREDMQQVRGDMQQVRGDIQRVREDVQKEAQENMRTIEKHMGMLQNDSREIKSLLGRGETGRKERRRR